MDYRVRRQGKELGTFSLEELRQRRTCGEFNGNEYVSCEGKFDWQPLDMLLRDGPEAMPPRRSPYAAQGPSQPAIWAVVVIATVVLVTAIAIGGFKAMKILKDAGLARIASSPRTSADALAAARKPVAWTTNTLTADDVNKRAKEFRVRQWEDGYRDHGRHDQPWDGDAKLLIKSWLAVNFGGRETNLPPVHDLSEKLAKAPGCDDPLVITVAAISSGEVHEEMRLLERANLGFAQSKYRAYPKFYAWMTLATATKERSQVEELDAAALPIFKEAFADGSFLAGDQAEIAELLVNGAGSGFFQRNHATICPIVQGAGKDFAWLAQVLEGEHEVIEAWRARGSDGADKVTSQGWQGFADHLASARKVFTAAWNQRPDLPLAPADMINVSLGDSDITEMRTWFDRAVGAQIDYPKAWTNLRWGLRPRWYGGSDAMLALGVTAVKTGRFDTDVPRMFFDAVTDVESEMNLDPGEHIYGRDDVWPHLKQMYQGYISAGEKAGSDSKGWRTTYAIIASFAEKFDVARAQFEALNWDPKYENFNNWNRDLSLLPAEVAARTGPVAETVMRAEAKRDHGAVAAALALYQKLDRDTNADTRTREFIQHRLAELEQEQRLQNGEWIDLQPKDDHDPNWVFLRGKAHVLPDGALEVESGPGGHMLYSRVRVGTQFEVRGEFEVVSSSTADFQAGIVMGLPELKGPTWNSFRLKRNETQGRVAEFGHGWSRQEVSRHAGLQPKRNSFTFRLDHFKGSATVDDKEILQNAAQPWSLYVKNEDYLLGLGAFNDVNNTVIRYSHMQVRRLAPTAATK